MARGWGGAGLLLAGFGAASVAAVAVGAAVCAISGEAPASLWVRNLSAWLIGALMAVGLSAIIRPGILPIVAWAAPVGLLATFASAGQQGVHRWIDVGPLHVNAAMLLLPSAVVSLALLAAKGRKVWIPPLAALALLAAQPDASQAMALAVAAVVIAGVVLRARPLGLGLMGISALFCAVAWMRPDPLLPVPEVEGIIRLAYSLSPVAAAGAVVALVAVVAVPALAVASSADPVRLAGRALALCFLLWIATPLLGAFPVPFVGIGLSPILGAWLGVGLLAGLMRRAA